MKARHAIIQDVAFDEINEIAEYIARDNLDAGQLFYDQLTDALGKFVAMPGLGSLRDIKDPALQQIRSWPIRGFENYLIFYLPRLGGGIEVLRVLHGARDVDRILDRG